LNNPKCNVHSKISRCMDLGRGFINCQIAELI
jgi:hypothetical protein